MADTHYVLVIHGTWNPPNPTSPTWHQLNESDPQNFCTRLNDELERLGLARPVWRQVHAQELNFGWSGANQHADRIVAGTKLHQLIRSIVDRDPSARIHLVAHSHGANVLLHALSLYLKTLRSEAQIILDEARAAARRADIAIPQTNIKNPILKVFLRNFYLMTMNWQRGKDPISLKESLEGVIRGKIGQEATDRLIQSLSEFNDERDAYSLVDRWMTFDACNRIGRLIFLGPPFFKKAWIRRDWWSLGSLTAEAFNFTSAIVLGLIMSFFLIEMIWAVHVWGIGSLLQLVLGFNGDLTPQVDPRFWPTWLQVIGVLCCVVYTIIVRNEFRQHQDVNPYFQMSDADTPSSDEVSAWFPFRTQVIHAGLLDEALLGYSAEPLVYGALVPQVQSLLRPRLSLSIEERRVGEGLVPSNAVFRVFAVPLRTLLWVLTKVMSPVTRMFERRLVKMLLHIISSPAYGLPVGEFSSAMYMTSHKIDQPKWFMETAWDVGKDLLASAAGRDSSGQAWTNRYSFLWDEVERRQRLESSWLREHLQAQTQTILARYRRIPNVDVAILEDTIVNTSLVLEERVKEVIGAVELTHSSYYTNETVIRGIARFIATGKNERDDLSPISQTPS